MSEYPVGKGECQETSGFLFSHPCGEVALRSCVKCQKEICDRHTVREVQAGDGEELVLCTTCAKESHAAAPGPGSRRTTDGYADNPHFYMYHHYPHSQHQLDRDEFTDADEAALGDSTAAGKTRRFEDDMGAS